MGGPGERGEGESKRMGEEVSREGGREGEREWDRGSSFSFSILQVANAGDDVLIFYNDHAFSTLQRLMKEDRDDAVSLTGKIQNK